VSGLKFIVEAKWDIIPPLT